MGRAARGLSVMVLVGSQWGCATLSTWWHEPNPSKVKQVDFYLDGIDETYGVLPGKPLDLHVAILDDKGKTYSTRDRTLGNRRLHVTVTHGRYDVDHRVFIPSKDAKAMVGETY